MVRRCSAAEVDEFLYESPLRFVTGSGLKLTVGVEVTPEGGVSKQKVDEARNALRELGLTMMLRRSD